MEELRTLEITDAEIERNDWQFPEDILTRPLQKAVREEFLTNHKIDRSYDDSTVKLKLLVGSAVGANLRKASKNLSDPPFDPEVLRSIKSQRWISDEYMHLWQRDEGGSAALRSSQILTFILQTPRDGHSFCSLSLVNRDRFYCAGLYVADEHFSLNRLLSKQIYENRHERVPRDFSILPFNILKHHVNQTLQQTQDLTKTIISTEKRIPDAQNRLDETHEFRQLNRLNLEHFRLQRRSYFEIELGQNLLKYLELYYKMWQSLWDGGEDYIHDMEEKIDQQMRYAEQVRKDLEVMPRRLDNISKALTNHIIRSDNKLNLQMLESSKSIAEQARLDNMLNLRLAKATAKVAEQTRQDSAAMKTIAILTLTFLPATAVASIFSMNGMFNWAADPNQPLASPYLYVYFVVTIPLTAIVYVCWILWFKVKEKQYKESTTDGEFAEIEKTLDNRWHTFRSNTYELQQWSPGTGKPRLQ